MEVETIMRNYDGIGIRPPHQLVVDRRGGGIRTAKSSTLSPSKRVAAQTSQSRNEELHYNEELNKTSCHTKETVTSVTTPVDGLPCPDTSSMAEGIMAIIEYLPVGSRRAPGLSLLCYKLNQFPVLCGLPSLRPVSMCIPSPVAFFAPSFCSHGYLCITTRTSALT